jgi:Carboxylesterase family
MPEESEDCLYLNVWAPSKKPPAEGWPVMFWIYGGNLQFGYSGKRIPLNASAKLMTSSPTNLQRREYGQAARCSRRHDQLSDKWYVILNTRQFLF